MARRVGTPAVLGAVAAVSVAAVALGGDRRELRVTVEAELYAVLSERIEIQPGASMSFYPEVLTLARLSVDSQPRGAEVTLDGALRGRTPLSIEDLELGAHELLVRDAAHATFRRRLRVERPPAP